MRNSRPHDEPLCQTSEKGEKLFSKAERLAISLDIGQRILEVFGYQQISSIVFRLRSTSDEIHSVIDGERMPSIELLLAVKQITGASIDWLLSGIGPKYLPASEPRFNSADKRSDRISYPVQLEVARSTPTPLETRE
ncbi:MAG TPA: hypothetical protein VGO43_08185 [Pyrinomonadaceae bacterium]|nr:hypothetical protein [Pyrinomonadaceae bacterium]